MNKLISTALEYCLFGLILLASCTNHEKKENDAFEHVKDEGLIAKDSLVIGKDTNTIRKGNTNLNKDQSLNTKKEESAKKIDAGDEWKKFKADTENKILLNETKINELKASSNGKLSRKIAKLEKTNNNLKRDLDEFKQQEKVKWESFKSTINHDINEVDIELKALKSEN